VDTHDRSDEAPGINELSQAILTWLDDRPRSLAHRSASSSWSSKELRDSFRANLDQALRHAVTAAKWIEVITYLVNAFTVTSSATLVETSQWSVALHDGSDSGTLNAMQGDITQLLEREAHEKEIPVLSPSKYATLIVDSLDAALRDEAARIPMNGTTAEAILRHYFISDDLRKKYNVRLFLFFVGLVVCIVPIYAFAEPSQWLNPGTALFIILAYATLIITAAIHERSSERFQ
jgi:hypothetical protein